MNISLTLLMLAPWTLWLFYWLARAKDVKATARRESPWSRMRQNLIVTAGALCIVVPSFSSASAYVFDWQTPTPLILIGLSLTLAGLLFTVWARAYLGRNWSAAVELKRDHELVRAGPYALVRHPIYSGCLLALFGCALFGDQPRALIGFAIVFLAIAHKVRMEEKILSAHFGTDYQHYRASVRALVPHLY